MNLLLNSPKADVRDVRPGQRFINVLSNGSQVLVRVVAFIESVQMWRVTDARETAPDAELIDTNRTWACSLENLHYIPGPDFACGPADYVKAFNDERAAKQAEHDRVTLSLCDRSATPAAQYVMGMLSDVQEALNMGQVKLANAICNDAKLIIDQRLSTKDSKGRQDFSPAEITREELSRG